MFKKKTSFLYLGLSLSLTLGIFFFPPAIKFDYDFESFFPQDDEELSFYQQFRSEFENDNDYLLIALGHQPDIFDSGFLERANLLRISLEEMEEVDKVFSLLDLEEPIISPFGIRNQAILEWDDPASLERAREKLMKSSLWKNNLINEKGDYLLIIVHNKQRISKEEGDLLYREILSSVLTSGLTDFYIAGKIKAQGEFVNLMQDEFSLFLGISAILIVILLFFIFRTFWGIIIPLIILAVGVLWTIAFALYLGKPLDIMSVMQPTILSVIGLAAIIHFFNHYLNFLRHGFGKEEAIEKSFTEMLPAVFLTCVTTSLGFISLYFTTVPTLKFFGLYTGIGVLLMFLSVIWISPSLLYIVPAFKHKNAQNNALKWRLGMRNSFSFVLDHNKSIPLFFLGISILCGVAISKLQINGYILDNLPRGHELVEEFRFFDHNFGGSKPLEFSLEPGNKSENIFQLEVLKELDKFEHFISETFETGTILSPLSLIKKLNQAQNSGNEKAYAMPSKGQFIRLQSYLEEALNLSPSKIVSDDLKKGRLSTRVEDYGSLKGSRLKEQMDEFLEKEIDNDYLKIRMTGTSHLIDISHESVTFQMLRGLVFAFFLVAIITGFLFRSWRVSIVVLIPNILPLIWMGGMMWVFGIDMKLTTAILFTVAFGIAVDDSIHFMSKLRLELSKGRTWLYALKRTFIDTGKAIILTTLILVAGFSVLIFSQFGVTYYSGLLISMSLVFALAADLMLLPILLLSLGKVWGKNTTSPNQVPQ
jgi:uncharacterized protein